MKKFVVARCESDRDVGCSVKVGLCRQSVEKERGFCKEERCRGGERGRDESCRENFFVRLC